VGSEQELSRGQATRRYWATLIARYGTFAALATLSGAFASSPWPICAVLFGVMEGVTFLATMYEDDWANDFKGDREIFFRGTAANVLVAAMFTACGVLLSG